MSQAKLLAIPGPIPLSSTVQSTLSLAPLSHVSPEFVGIFKESMELTRVVVGASPPKVGEEEKNEHGGDGKKNENGKKEGKDGKGSEVFLVSGSGTLGWDMVGGNLVDLSTGEGKGEGEGKEKWLVVSTGYFGDGFADCLKIYGASVDILRASSVGSTVPSKEIEEALKAEKYKALTVTHVDTSTGVLSDVRGIAEVVRRVSPETLVIVDAVCSVASENLQMDAWGLDVILSASQKGLGAPPGLCVLVASARAISAFENRKSSQKTYYASWEKWLPIMRAYGEGKPAYFATPSVNLVRAYHASLKEIVGGGLEKRYEMHKRVSERVKMVARQLGLKNVVREEKSEANGMTAVYLPEGKTTGEVVPKMGEKGVVIAGGLIGEIKDKYIRIGHMGESVMNGETEKVVQVLEEVLRRD